MIKDDLDQEFDEALEVAARKAYDEVEAFYKELNAESSRVAAILVVAKIDEELTSVIKRYFPANVCDEQDPLSKIFNLIFGGAGPYGSLYKKSEMAKKIGVFGKKTHETIQKMCEIRNLFAHGLSVRTFDHPDVLKLCAELGRYPIFNYELSDTATEAEIRSAFITVARCLHQRLEMIAPRVSGPGDPQGPLP